MTACQSDIVKGEDGKYRCSWAGQDPLYHSYHDKEWGRPLHCDKKLFEQLSLEIFQAGLSWYTVLKKRYAFRHAFENFDFYKIAHYNQKKIEVLCADKRIIRHRGKIIATIHNAQQAIKLVQECGSLDSYFWSLGYVQPPVTENLPQTPRQEEVGRAQEQAGPVPKEAKHLFLDLKKRGWLFVGEKVCYAFMQAVGLRNDHAPRCSFRSLPDF